MKSIVGEVINRSRGLPNSSVSYLQLLLKTLAMHIQPRTRHFHIERPFGPHNLAEKWLAKDAHFGADQSHFLVAPDRSQAGQECVSVTEP